MRVPRARIVSCTTIALIHFLVFLSALLARGYRDEYLPSGLPGTTARRSASENTTATVLSLPEKLSFRMDSGGFREERQGRRGSRISPTSPTSDAQPKEPLVIVERIFAIS